MNKTNDFNFLIEQFADLKIMRFQVPGFDALHLSQKKLLYYLSQAALCGRDIIFDQNFKYNLLIRDAFEKIHKYYSGDRDSKDFQDFMVYLKRIWFSNGIHHHYSMDKLIPEFSSYFFKDLVEDTKIDFELSKNELLELLTPIIFDPDIAQKRVSLDASKDLITSSSCNYYEDVTQLEAEQFYQQFKKENDLQPISFGLNSRLIKRDGKIIEEIYKHQGLYGPAIDKIIFWLEKANDEAENKNQKLSIELLIKYYQTGDLRIFDEYNIAWLKDTASHTDFVNGFIETYGDPLGLKASWEAMVNFKDIEATKRAETISENAQWFEDHSPVDPRFKKKKVKGVTAKVIMAVQLGGDCFPSTPIGINLPNADWIRKEHGSKSVTIENITYAYDQASQGSGFLEEFCYSEEEIALAKKYNSLAGNLHTDLHECLGHGSGQLLPGTSVDALKSYSSTLEEARADLFALYFLFDDKMLELNIFQDMDVAKCEYNSYIRNGLLTQLTRIDPGKDIEESHMRNRQLIAKWCFEKGKSDNIIEEIRNNGKTYIKINNYVKLRDLFGELLAEVQRIKSEGDYDAGKKLVEKYAVKVDLTLNKEVRQRFDKLNIAPYGGFLNPTLKPIYKNAEIIDIEIEYPESYMEQMMHYSEEFSFLKPTT